MQSLKDLNIKDADTLYLKLWLQLARSSKAMEQQMETRFQKHFKQSLSRFDLLAQLDRFDPEWLPMGKLGSQLIASKGNITGLVDRMVSEKLIHRRPNPEDRRIIQVGLTDKGRALFEAMAVAHVDWAKLLLADLNHKDGEQLLKLLKDFNAVFKNKAADKAKW